MKRTVIGILLVVMLVSCLSFAGAEDVITFRDGINFGDTEETIRSKATFEFSEYNQADINLTKKYYGATSVPYAHNLSVGGTSATAFFIIDENGLKEVSYRIGMWSDTEKNLLDQDEVFSQLKNLLTKKYGTPLDGDIAKNPISAIATHAQIGPMIYNEQLGQTTGTKYKSYDFAEWCIEQKDYQVKIELNLCTRQKDSYLVLLSYRCITNEEMENTDKEFQNPHQYSLDTL